LEDNIFDDNERKFEDKQEAGVSSYLILIVMRHFGLLMKRRLDVQTIEEEKK